MSRSNLMLIDAICEAFGGEPVDRAEHVEPRGGSRLDVGAQQALFRQRGQVLERSTGSRANRFGVLQCEAATEAAHFLEHPLRAIVEQLVTPSDCGTESLVTFRHIPHPSADVGT